MDTLKTNQDVYNLLRHSGIKFCGKSLAAAVPRVEEAVGVTFSPAQNRTMGKFLANLRMKWSEAGRRNDSFLKKSHRWLAMTFTFPKNIRDLERPESAPTARDGKPEVKTFGELCDRQKRRRTEAIRGQPKEHVSFVAKKNLKSSDAQYVFDFVEQHPKHVKAIREFCENLSKPKVKITKEKALNVFVSAKLTKFQYNIVREAGKELGQESFPSYYQIQKAKNDCYPPENSIKITETSVNINLQSLLDKTAERLLQVIEKKVDGAQKLKLLSKWGCDGASNQSQYNIGKVCNTISNTTSAMRCYICHASPKEMNDLERVHKKAVKEEFYSFGLSSLHAWIRSFECLLHIAYNLDFKAWSARSTVQKEQRERRKKTIQDGFRSKIGILVDVIKPGQGTSNDGNTARRFFADPQLSAQITGLDARLIKRMSVILQAIASGCEINTEKFHKYSLETANLYVSLYEWYYMPASVHKLLIHGAEIVKHAIVPIGQLSEEAQETNHKLFRAYRENHSRKVSRVKNNEDVLHSLLLASDPLISSMRKLCTVKSKELLPEAIELLNLDV